VDVKPVDVAAGVDPHRRDDRDRRIGEFSRGRELVVGEHGQVQRDREPEAQRLQAADDAQAGPEIG
jgi:hypothetical protein